MHQASDNGISEQNLNPISTRSSGQLQKSVQQERAEIPCKTLTICTAKK